MSTHNLINVLHPKQTQEYKCTVLQYYLTINFRKMECLLHSPQASRSQAGSHSWSPGRPGFQVWTTMGLMEL